MSIHLGQPVIALQTADVAKVNDTFVDTLLSIPIAANQRFKGRIACAVDLAGAASGAKFQITVPAGGTVYQVEYAIINGSTTAVAQADVIVAAAAFSNALANIAVHYMTCDFYIANGVTAGNVTLQFAQLVTDAAAATLLTGATMQVLKF